MKILGILLFSSLISLTHASSRIQLICAENTEGAFALLPANLYLANLDLPSFYSGERIESFTASKINKQFQAMVNCFVPYFQLKPAPNQESHLISYSLDTGLPGASLNVWALSHEQMTQTVEELDHDCSFMAYENNTPDIFTTEPHQLPMFSSGQRSQSSRHMALSVVAAMTYLVGFQNTGALIAAINTFSLAQAQGLSAFSIAAMISSNRMKAHVNSQFISLLEEKESELLSVSVGADNAYNRYRNILGNDNHPKEPWSHSETKKHYFELVVRLGLALSKSTNAQEQRSVISNFKSSLPVYPEHLALLGEGADATLLAIAYVGYKPLRQIVNGLSLSPLTAVTLAQYMTDSAVWYLYGKPVSECISFFPHQPRQSSLSPANIAFRFNQLFTDYFWFSSYVLYKANQLRRLRLNY